MSDSELEAQETPLEEAPLEVPEDRPVDPDASVETVNPDAQGNGLEGVDPGPVVSDEELANELAEEDAKEDAPEEPEEAEDAWEGDKDAPEEPEVPEDNPEELKPAPETEPAAGSAAMPEDHVDAPPPEDTKSDEEKVDDAVTLHRHLVEAHALIPGLRKDDSKVHSVLHELDTFLQQFKGKLEALIDGAPLAGA